MGALPAIDGAAPAKTLSSRLSRGKAVSNKAFIEASDENYLHVRNLKLLHGRNLSPIDQENRSKVIVLGSVVANELFGTTDAVGQKVRLDGDEFVVVGVLQDQGQSMGLTTGNLALVPFSTAVGMGRALASTRSTRRRGARTASTRPSGPSNRTLRAVRAFRRGSSPSCRRTRCCAPATRSTAR